MATVTVQATPAGAYAQARTVRATTTWSPPMHTRPWRSSPLAGPAFSTLPTIISESSEESHENESQEPKSPRVLAHSRSPSSSSIEAGSISASASGYGSRNDSGSALAFAEDEASTSSHSFLASTTSAHGTSSSQGHGNRPNRLSKSLRPRTAPSSSEVFITPPPRARTVSHGHSRPASVPVVPTPSSSLIPPAYSRTQPDINTHKQPPSSSRDPASNWMSSSPFGPGMTPKFSRLSMASPAVVMPLSAKEYRKRKTKESQGTHKGKEPPTSSNHVIFDGIPVVRVSSPPPEDAHQPCISSLPPGSPKTQPQPHLNHPHSKLPLHAIPSTQPQRRPSSPKQKPLRSRPNTPPRSSPLIGHPPISPKSSAGTFFSFASGSDDDSPVPSRPPGMDAPPSTSSSADDPNVASAIPPARPRPRPRRKSYPDRLSNGARLSLLEAVNRLSQESPSVYRLSGLSQADIGNRLSVASQASGHTLFYDIVESEGVNQVVSGKGNADEAGQCMPVLHTQSLEDLSSTLTRTGIEATRPEDDGSLGAASGDVQKGKRNVRMVRISDTVEVSPPPVPRRRKLTKSRPGSIRGTALRTIKETKEQSQTPERRASLLPWKSKGLGDSKSGAVVGSPSAMIASVVEKTDEAGLLSTPIKNVVRSNETTLPTHVPHPSPPFVNESTRVDGHLKLKFTRSPTKKMSGDSPRPTPTATVGSGSGLLPSAPCKARRHTFSFLPSPTFHRSKRERSNTAPPSVDLGSCHNMRHMPNESIRSVESCTGSTSTSIRTITQESESTLAPTSSELYDLTTLGSSGGLPGSIRGKDSSAVPILRRLNAQEMTTSEAPLQGEWDDQGSSTPSLITDRSTATSANMPRTSTSVIRLSSGAGRERFVPRPSGLKESFTDTSEEDSDDVPGAGRMVRMCVHQRQQSPLARNSAAIGGAETSEEDERVHLRSISNPSLHPGSRPGTSSSTLTTATDRSGSYLSFSTVDPASSVSLSTTSRSTSPAPMMIEKRNRGASALHEDGEAYACALCGHLGPRSTSPASFLSSSPKPDQSEMHPMFTIPLLTVPTSAVSLVESYPRSTGTGSGTRYGEGRKSSGRVCVPVPAAVSVSGPLPGQNRHAATAHIDANGYSSGSVLMTSTKTNIGSMADKTTILPLPSPSKVRRPRPQTAPPSTGDLALKFIEDGKTSCTRERSADIHDKGVDRLTRPKFGGGESKFKKVLKGLLKWNG